MKSLVIAAISILASVQLCSADLFGDFKGIWNQDGMSPGSKTTTVYKRFQNKGLIATTTIIFPGVAKSISVTKYYDNGKMKGEMRRDGVVISTLAGTWSISGQSLKAKTKVSAPLFPKFSENVTTTLVSANKIGMLSISSNGVRYSAKMTRKR